MKVVLKRIKKEVVFVISLILALISCFFIKPDSEYLNYIDFKVIGLLFCLMAVVSGLSEIRIFKILAIRLISKVKSLRALVSVLLILPFFSAMIITNDVALITFVPLAIETLRLCNKEDTIIYTVVLQAVFANLGSMLTPMGNPQNLYLYSYYGLSGAEFFKITLPVIILSFILLLFSVIFVKKDILNVKEENRETIDKKIFYIYLVLGFISLFAVFNSNEFIVFSAVFLVAIALLIFNKGVFKNIDWFLLLTFICFFVFVGNAGRIETVRTVIESGIQGNEFIYSVVLSQFISNVPCAVMLAGFSNNYTALILGTNIGGLGTLVASLASLIAFRLYAKYEGAKKGKFLAVFSGINLIFLLILTVFCSIMFCKYFYKG